MRVAGTTPAPALLVVEGVEVQQERGPVTFAPSTATEVELTLAMPNQRLRLRWASGGVGGPWSRWVSAALKPLLAWPIVDTCVYGEGLLYCVCVWYICVEWDV